MPTEWEEKRRIVEVCRRMYERGYIVASEGNVSVKIGPSRIIATPSGAPKGSLSPDQLVVVDREGRQLAGRNQPSSELLLHLKVYELRPDVKAVVHAHPPTAIAFSIAGIPLTESVLPEVVVDLGAIVTAPYATPASPEGPESIADLIRDYDAIILDRHGSVTVGADLNDAYMKLETVEHSAYITYLAHTLGQVGVLPEEEVAKLVAIREKMGRSGHPTDANDSHPSSRDGGTRKNANARASAPSSGNGHRRSPRPNAAPTPAGSSEETFEAIYAAVLEELLRTASP